jgi:hypothetical protein
MIGRVATFDTLTAARRLKEAGATDALAEAIAETIRDARDFDLSQLATTADLRAGIAEVRSEMSALETRLIRWVVGVAVGAVIAIIGALGGIIWTATQVILHGR